MWEYIANVVIVGKTYECTDITAHKHTIQVLGHVLCSLISFIQRCIFYVHFSPNRNCPTRYFVRFAFSRCAIFPQYTFSCIAFASPKPFVWSETRKLQCMHFYRWTGWMNFILICILFPIWNEYGEKKKKNWKNAVNVLWPYYPKMPDMQILSHRAKIDILQLVSA